MIVVAGSPTDAPVELVLDAAAAASIDVALLDDSDAASWNVTIDATGPAVRATAKTTEGIVDLHEASGLYLRMTTRVQPVPGEDQLVGQRREASLALLASWADVAPGNVANRPAAMATNSSKPYQAALIRAHGFSVPDTLVTNDPRAVQHFWSEQDRVIFKSTSGVRSIVHELDGRRASALDRVRSLPTQFQRLLEGSNVRVHVVGDAVFAVGIESATVDYRYREGGETATMTPYDLPDEVAERCRQISRALDLPFTGIDLFLDTDGEWWCFEANPSPAFSCFEEPTGLPMAQALVAWLAAGEE